MGGLSGLVGVVALSDNEGCPVADAGYVNPRTARAESHPRLARQARAGKPPMAPGADGYAAYHGEIRDGPFIKPNMWRFAMWRRVLAIPVLLLGILALAGAAYSFFGERHPDFQSRVGGGLFFGVALIFIGVRWLRGKVAE